MFVFLEKAITSYSSLPTNLVSNLHQTEEELMLRRHLEFLIITLKFSHTSCKAEAPEQILVAMVLNWHSSLPNLCGFIVVIGRSTKGEPWEDQEIPEGPPQNI